MKSLSWSRYDKVVDRDEESDSIIREIEENKVNKIHILYSKTAIGKSAIISKVLEKYDGIKYDVIRINSIPNNNSKDNAWEYLESIFKGICDYYDKMAEIDYCGLSFDNYLTENRDIEINELRISTTVKEWFFTKNKAGIIKKVLYTLLKRCVKLDEFSVNAYKYNDSFYGKRIHSNYIKYVLSQHPILLIMDNLQNIDKYSLQCLTEWLAASSKLNHFFLFEFTLDELGNLAPLYSLADLLSLYADVKTSPVSETDSKYIVDIISRKIDQIPGELDFNVNVLKHYKTVSSGNIKEIIDFSFTYSEIYKTSNENEMINGTLQNIRTASYPNGQYIIALLNLHEGRMEISLLKSLVTTQMDIQKELRALSNQNLIHIFQQNVEFDHASIRDQWEKNIGEFQELDSLAYNNLKKYYKKRMENSAFDIQNEAWTMLLKLYALREPFLIKSLLAHLEQKIIVSISPESVCEYIGEIFNVIKTSPDEYEEIFFRLLEICFKLELYDDGFQIVQFLETIPLYNDNNHLKIHKVLYLSAIDKHVHAVQCFESAIQIVKLQSRTGLNLMLSVLCSYRYTGMIERCLEIHKEIIRHKSIYENYPEYAYFLRLTNIYLPNRKSIYYSKASIKLFCEQKNAYQEGKSQITYAKLLAGLGKYKKALKYLLKAEQLLDKNGIRNNVLWVNKASILLMQGIHNNYVWELLCKSDYTAVTSYDKLAIVIVKLAWCYENKEFSNLAMLIHEGEKLVRKEPDYHIHALFYYNLYAIYKLKGNNTDANKYYEKSISLKEHSRYIKARVNGPKTKEEKERLKKPWFICYLSFWNHDIEYFSDIPEG